MTSATSPAPRRLAPPTPRVALVIGAAIVVGVVLYLGRHALAPFIVGALIVYLLDPAVGWLSRVRIAGRTMPRVLAVLVVYLVALFIIIEGLALLVGAAGAPAARVPARPADPARVTRRHARPAGQRLPVARAAAGRTRRDRRGPGRSGRGRRWHRLRLAAADRPVGAQHRGRLLRLPDHPDLGVLHPARPGAPDRPVPELAARRRGATRRGQS